MLHRRRFVGSGIGRRRSVGRGQPVGSLGPLTFTGLSASVGTASATVQTPVTAAGTSATAGAVDATVGVPITASGSSASAGTGLPDLALPITASSVSASVGTASVSLFGQRNAINTKEAAWDFSADSVTLSGSEITAMADLTGNGATMTPAGTGPTWAASGLNGKPTATFSGAEYMTATLGTAIAAGARPSFYCVSRLDSVSNQLAFHALDGSNFMFTGRKNGSSWNTGGGVTSWGVTYGTAGISWRRHAAEWRSAGHRGYLDGAVGNTSAETGGLSSGTIGAVAIGGTTTGSLLLTGEVAYADVAISAPSDADFTTGDGFAATEYGL